MIGRLPSNVMLRKLAERMQLDRPLAYALSSRFWQAVSGPITIALIIRALSEDEQGIYYAFIPVIGIQAFFELGLLNVLISHAGHASAAHDAAAGSQDESAQASADGRMGELIRASNRWFAAASVLFALSALVFGWYTFSSSDLAGGWQWPLVVLVPLAAISVFFAPSLAILEGAGHREMIYRFRFIQMVCGSAAVWIALVAGAGVWAIVIATAVQAICSAYLALVHMASFFSRYRTTTCSEHFSWRRDVLPLQWRVAVNGAAYHLATQFLVTVVLTFHTAAESGRLGMTLSVTMAIQMLALAWTQTKYSLISSMHGKGDREQAGTMWRHTAVVSSGLLVVAFALLAAAVAALALFERGWENRFIAPWQLIVLGIGCLANHLVALQSFYVLARGAKPLVAASLPGLLMTAAAVWIAGYYGATSGVVIAFTAGMALILLPMHTWAYLRFRAQYSF